MRHDVTKRILWVQSACQAGDSFLVDTADCSSAAAAVAVAVVRNKLWNK